MNDFAPWEEWKTLCDSAKCTEETRTALERFARASWNSLLHRLSGGADIPEDGEVTGKFPWHRFESHCVIKQTVEGKACKDWLFARLDLPEGTPPDKIKSGAYLIMRSVVREYLRKEGRFRLPGFQRPQPSLSEPVSNSEDGLTVEDMLTNTVAPGQDIELRDLQRVAMEEARAIVKDQFNERQRIVFTAVAVQVALSKPEVERIAGCKKSVLSDTLIKALREIAANIHRDYAKDDPLVRNELIRYVVRAVLEICAKPENQPEMWQSCLFSLAADNEQ